MYDNSIESIKKIQNGDIQELEKIVINNSGLIWSIVKRFNNRGYELDDLYQIASYAFIKAVKRFDITYDVKLSTYVVPYMLGEIKKYIRDNSMLKVSRSLKELYVKIKELQKEYMIRKGIEISLEDISKELKVSIEEINLALETTNVIESIEDSKYTNNKDGNSISLLETISNGKNEAEDITNKIVLKQLIEQLKSREKEVIMLRFFKEKTQSEVGRILGITQVQVSRIERKVLEEMKNKFLSCG